MNLVENTFGITKYAPSLKPNVDLYDLVLQKHEFPHVLFINKYPETLGLKINKGDLVFDLETMDSEFNRPQPIYDVVLSSIIKGNFSELIMKYLIENGQWEMIESILSALPQEKIDSLKQVTANINYHNFLGASSDVVISMVKIFSEIDWTTALWKPRDGHGHHHWSSTDSYMAKFSHEKEEQPLIVYSYIKGLYERGFKIDNAKNLFWSLHEVLYRTNYNMLPNELKTTIIKDVVLSTYPILVNASEIYQKYDSECKIHQIDLNAKIARLAFREYRQNNGLCEKNYSKFQKKDITEMFLECLSKKTINTDILKIRKFVEIVGKDQEVKKALLKRGMIEKALESV